MIFDVEERRKPVWVPWKFWIDLLVYPVPLSKQNEIQRKIFVKKTGWDGKHQKEVNEVFDFENWIKEMAKLVVDWRGPLFDKNNQPLQPTEINKIAFIDWGSVRDEFGDPSPNSLGKFIQDNAQKLASFEEKEKEAEVENFLSSGDGSTTRDGPALIVK